jgi:two-component system cell cycle sensor histidine kinase/response regulator CckA
MPDISNRTPVEQALQDADRTRAALRATGTAVWELDLECGEVTWSANLATLVKRPLERFSVKEGLRWVHAEDAGRVRAACMATLKNHSAYSVEFRVMWPDGTVRWLLSVGRVVERVDGQPARLIGSTIDVTDRRTLEVQLRQSQKLEAVGLLAGGFAHDFNNLLTVIQGYAQLVADKAGDAQQSFEIGEVVQAADRAGELTQQLLAFSRHQTLAPAPFDLNVIINDLVRLRRPSIGGDVDLVVSLADRVGSVCADKEQMGQAIVNLVTNAREAMPHGGRITVETDQVEIAHAGAVDGVGVDAGQYARVTVRDTGTGMSEDTKARIFEPFFTTKAPGQGSGLGLSTAYGIVRQSGGHLRVQSEPGAGSAFEIWLPLTDQTPQPAAEATPEHTRSAGGHRVVLVIEDQTAVRTLVRRILEREGFGVLEAAEPAYAEVLFDEHKAEIALVVTDILMPGEKGPDLFRRLALKKPDLRVVYMSGHIEETALGEEGCPIEGPFLAKPFTGAGLIGVVEDALRE